MNPILNFLSSLHFVYYHNQHGIDRGETFQYTRGPEQNFWNRAYYFYKKSPLPQKPPPVTNSFIFSSLSTWAQIQGSLCLTFNTPCTQLCVVVDILLCHAVSEVNCLRMLVKIELTQWRTICSRGWQRKRTFLESDHPSGCKGDCWNTGSFSGQNGFIESVACVICVPVRRGSFTILRSQGGPVVSVTPPHFMRLFKASNLLQVGKTPWQSGECPLFWHSVTPHHISKIFATPPDLNENCIVPLCSLAYWYIC